MLNLYLFHHHLPKRLRLRQQIYNLHPCHIHLYLLHHHSKRFRPRRHIQHLHSCQVHLYLLHCQTKLRQPREKKTTLAASMPSPSLSATSQKHPTLKISLHSDLSSSTSLPHQSTSKGQLSHEVRSP